VENGKTPLLTADELGRMGFKLVIFPNTAMRAAMMAMEKTLAELLVERTSSSMLDRLASMADRNRITGMDRIKELERRYAHQVE
jgi:2-methylisocitrate lyase-like PEP mutase family enzyme